jgi:hypothetical protein
MALTYQFEIVFPTGLPPQYTCVEIELHHCLVVVQQSINEMGKRLELFYS